MWLWLSLLFSCGAHLQRVGLIAQDENRTVLLDPDGRMLRLVATGDARAVYQLTGCRVTLQGPAMGGKLMVQQWEVTDSGFGSVPYVGRLKRYGGNWLLADRNSGSTMVIEPETLGQLESHDGDLVLIDGLIVGVHVLRVMVWRLLLEGDTSEASPG